METVARESIAETVAYILEWFNIDIDVKVVIGERDCRICDSSFGSTSFEIFIETVPSMISMTGLISSRGSIVLPTAGMTEL